MFSVTQMNGARHSLSRPSSVPGWRVALPKRPGASRPLAAIGPGRNQPMSKGLPQHNIRPRPELSNEAHSTNVHVVERQWHVTQESDRGHQANGHGTNAHATNGHGTNDEERNGHAKGHTSTVGVVEAPLKADKAVADVASGILSGAKAHGLLPNMKGKVEQNGTVEAAPKPDPQPSPIPAEARKIRVTSAQTLAFVLGGGQGSELYPLTATRAEPAVPLFGSYRLIDVPLSNCLNSTVPINKVYVLTQYNSTPLNRHLATAYSFVNSLQFSNDMSFIEPLNATLTNMKEKEKDWFQGTADAVRHYAWTLNDPRLEQVQEVLILSGDQIYRMDYTELIQYHRHTGSDITIACTPCSQYEAEQFGVCTVNKELKVVGFNEKPKGSLLKALAMDTSVLGVSKETAAAKPYAANMGVYVFKKRVLLDLLKEQPNAADFSRDIITNSIGSMDDFDEPAGPMLNIMAYPFRGYWRDVGGLRSYFDANLDMTSKGASFPLRLRDKPLYTEARVLPPTKMVNAEVQDTVVGHGTLLRGCSVTRSVLGDCTTIREGSIVEDAIVIGCSYRDSKADEANCTSPLLGIGQNCRLRNVIVDRDARIGDNCTIVNEAGVMEANHQDLGYCIRDGIVCILRGATIAPGTTV